MGSGKIMKKFFGLTLMMLIILVFGFNAYAQNTAPQCDKLKIHIDFYNPQNVYSSTVRFNLFTEDDIFLQNSYADITNAQSGFDILFDIGTYNSGTKFKLKLTEGISSFKYYDTEYKSGEPVLIETYAYLDENGEVKVCDTFHFSATPNEKGFILQSNAEFFVNKNNIQSKTDWLIWVSKKDFRVVVFNKAEDKWKYNTSFMCTIGKPSTPTITGEFEYYMTQPKWTYPKYWCGPVMRFKSGYAFHSTLIKYNGEPYDARLGVKASLGCVRLHPDNINWLTDNIPLNTKVYITE